MDIPAVLLVPSLALACCVDICDTACGDGLDVVVYLGPRAAAMLALREAETEDVAVEDEEAADLRKTRAGGNWLMGGILNDLRMMMILAI
jgi:hypothetical protein